MGTSEETNEAKDQICHLFPMEEKWILTTKTDLSFIPSLEKSGAHFFLCFVKILGTNYSLPDNNTSSHTNTLTQSSKNQIWGGGGNKQL